MMITKENMTNAVRCERISIDRLVLDPTFQVRSKLNEQAIGQYREAYRLERELDPVRVAEVDGMLMLIDGWHRITALKRLGRPYVDAEIEPMTRDDARWAASIANAKHGVPLSRQDHLNVFKNYIATERHIKAKSLTGIKYKSYRDIAAELPINRSHGTIRNWMTEHYPDIAKAMGGASTASDDYEGQRRASKAPELPDTASRLAGALLTHFQSVSDPQQRGIMIVEVRELLHRMEGSPGWTEPPPPEF
ncbi:ParB-like nuclease domain-containing protein [Bradyrhizobium sp. 139]|uniref:ParB/RepB/Spo0J family partition protein n=1 Tax=Bradyrhizobium sp. 139 TaxID=2782616 RepID=UPI001FFA4D6E|nr:ParB/RepB/Spo0J family partition protein [Bradyrhizobium sp. 139]MCK1745915.1 ParB-like nuclease domain-containing protein [Bradyrhizobium sp. 139]